LAIALLAGKISERLLKSDRAQIVLNRFAGTVFVVLAAKLGSAHPARQR
jgi:threonine/homoserine/homoserine lactone efflux protein